MVRHAFATSTFGFAFEFERYNFVAFVYLSLNRYKSSFAI